LFISLEIKTRSGTVGSKTQFMEESLYTKLLVPIFYTENCPAYAEESMKSRK
jgi:hypothetical protein